MHVYNRDGELVPIPTVITRDQVDAALAALGIPARIGWTKITLGVFETTVEHRLVDENGQTAGPTPAVVTIPRARAPLAQGGPVECGNGPDYHSDRWG